MGYQLKLRVRRRFHDVRYDCDASCAAYRIETSVHPAQFSGALVCASSIMHIKYSSRSKFA